MRFSLERIASPLGTILAVGSETALHALDFADHTPRMERFLTRRYATVELHAGPAGFEIAGRLERYFGGAWDAFDGLPLQAGGTPFQERVWAALLTIPPGTTTTYGGLADALGNPAATRAVGLANGANPIAIAIPCHRVVGAGGLLTGYGGGLPRKAWLLRHEGIVLPGGVLPGQLGFAFGPAAP